jgi:hypothetical protein
MFRLLHLCPTCRQISSCPRVPWKQTGSFELMLFQSWIDLYRLNRCFFLHLGIAMQIHPFVLQVIFRQWSAVRQQQCAADDFSRDILSTLNEYSGFVDANSLCFLWPKEFNGARLCFISGSFDCPMFSCFFVKGCPIDRDIIIHCSGSHFTLLASGIVNDQVASITVLIRWKHNDACFIFVRRYCHECWRMRRPQDGLYK